MGGPESERTGRSDLEATIATLRNRKWLILLCFAVTTLVAVGFSFTQQKKYSASASLLFRNPGFAQDLFGSNATPPSQDPTREAATNVKLVGLEVVAARTARAFDNGLTPRQVSNMVSVAAAGQSDVVSVTATDPSPARAKRVANTFGRQFIAFRADADRSKLLQAQRMAENRLSQLPPSEQNGPQGRPLGQAAERLGVLASLQTGNAELVQPAALPTSPSSPKPIRNGILGAVGGLLLGIALAFVFERLNRRLREPEEMKDAFGLPVLGTIPESKDLWAGVEDGILSFEDHEAFRTLRAALRYFNVDRDVGSVVVTSASPEEGKSTVAWYLASAAAANARVVLVEADLRRPNLASRHEHLSPAPGLAEVLTHQLRLEEAMQEVPVAGGNGSPAGGDGSTGQRSLSVLAAGVVPPNPTELMESHTMTELLARLADDYDFVVLDTPPTSVVSDAFPLVTKVSGVIIVSRLGKATRDSAVSIREQLDRLKAPLLGVVANRVKRGRRGKYGYGYGYGYGQLAAAESPSEAEAHFSSS